MGTTTTTTTDSSFDCQCGTIMEDSWDEEIPELVRVFCGIDHHHNPNFHPKSGFDYRGAMDLLKRDPSQVQYATYEYKKRRNLSFQKDTTRIPIQTLHSPLRWACIETTHEQEAMEFLKAIRAIDPTQFLLQDSHGQLPIDGECVLNASLELLQFLLEIYLDYDFFCPNGMGMTEANFNPITCLCGSYWWEDIRQATEEIVSGKRTVIGKNVLEDNLGIEHNFWKKIILLTKAFYHKQIHDDEETSDSSNSDSSCCSMLRITNEYADRRIQFRLLHACVGIDWFPPNLLRLLVAAFPKALLEEDEDGNLPIHVAAGGCFESYRTVDASSWETLEANSGYQKTTIDILLEANPNLAQIPNGEGRLPLELAIESSQRPWEDGGIGSLLEAYPEAAQIRSTVTGKLPLEIALGSVRDWEDGVQALLEAYPEAARLRNPTTGKYPLQLAIERETHFDRGVYGLLAVSPEACSSVIVANRETREPQNRSQKRSSNDDCNSASTTTKDKRWLPLFAHAAMEKCSASVVYKLLRTNPESCRRTDPIQKKRKQSNYENSATTTPPSNKRLRI